MIDDVSNTKRFVAGISTRGFKPSGLKKRKPAKKTKPQGSGRSSEDSVTGFNPKVVYEGEVMDDTRTPVGAIDREIIDAEIVPEALQTRRPALPAPQKALPRQFNELN